MSLSLNPLANPRGTKLTCEICQKSAFSQCTHCKVTFYCGRDHQAEDWDGIHSKVCTLLAILRAPKPFLNSEEQRRQYAAQRAEKLKKLVALTSTEARRLLYDGQHRRAMPAAQLASRSSIELYGSGSLQTIPTMVVLGETCIGVELFNQAEQFLSQAKWCVSKAGPQAPSFMVSLINRNMGRLYIAKGDQKRAMSYLAEDVYHSSLEYGTEHIRTSGGYFNMARAFLLDNNVEVALPLYTQVLSIWHAFLTDESMDCNTESLTADGSISSPQSGKKTRLNSALAVDKLDRELDDAQKAEALFMLRELAATFSSDSWPSTPSQLCKCYQSLAVLFAVMNKPEQASQYCQSALPLCQDHEDVELQHLSSVQKTLQQTLM